MPTLEGRSPRDDGAPGLRAGFGALFRGVGFVFATPRVWPYAAVPALILATLASGLVYLAVSLVTPAVESWLGEPSSWYGELGVTLATILSAVLAGGLGLLIALALTPPLSGPALERIVAEKEQRLGAPPREALGFLAEMWCGLRAQMFAAAFALPIMIALWIVDLLLPPAVVVTIPLKFLVASFALAWNLFDYPLTLRGMRIRRRLSLVRRYKAATLGFGLAFTLLFFIPCFGVLLLPVGVAAATELVWRMLRAESGTPDGTAQF
jgi:CysZ protein